MDSDDLAQQLLNEFNVSTEESRIDDNECEENDARFDNNENYISNGQRLIKFNFSWIEGLRTGSRLVWVPEEENIYYSNAINTKFNAIACTCYENDCNVRIFIMEDGTASKETNASSHTHGSLYQVYKERYLYTWMKERCRTAPASALIRDIFNEAVVM